MTLRKTIGGSIGAIIILIISQILAQLLASLFSLILPIIPEGIFNIAAGVIHLFLTYILLKLFANRVLKMDLKNLGIPKCKINIKWLVLAVAFPALIKLTYLLMPGHFVRTEMNGTKMFSIISVGVFFTGIATGFVEEMVFRGFILNLFKNKWNQKIAIIIPSVLFGAVHIIGMEFSLLSCLLVLIAGTIVGIMFSLIELHDNSIWNSGIVHSLWNIIIIGGGLTISESADDYSIITYVLDSKNFAITGGEFGIESSIIAVIGYTLVALIAAFMIKKKR